MLEIDKLDNILGKNPNDAWKSITEYLEDIFSSSIDVNNIEGNILSREKETSYIESVLSDSCHDLWDAFENSTYKTSKAIEDFWANTDDGKAVLILDGLSIRERNYILDGLKSRGYIIEKSIITSTELPSDTNTFAKSIGLSHRGSLENNGINQRHSVFGNANTDCIGTSWKESKGIIGSEKNWLIWHQYPDKILHDFNIPGYGIQKLSRNIYEMLIDDDFWQFIKKLSNGREVVITSDHGYAATGIFMNINDPTQKDYLKKNYKSSRYRFGSNMEYTWTPPIEKTITNKHGNYSFVLGRVKWKNQGGYPTLSHGGISLLEAMVPFIQFRQEGK